MLCPLQRSFLFLLGLFYYISSLHHSTSSSELSSFLFHFLYLISFPIHFTLPDDANRLPIILGLQFTMNFFILLHLLFSFYLYSFYTFGCYELIPSSFQFTMNFSLFYFISFISFHFCLIVHFRVM